MKTKDITLNPLAHCHSVLPVSISHRLRHLLLFAAATAFVLPADAAVLTKADNSTALGTAGSYTNSTATPTNSDTVVFDGTFATTTSTISAGGVSIRTLQILSPGNDIKLDVGSQTFSIGVNNGISGTIDLSSATKNLTISGNGVLRVYGSASTITVASGITFTISSQLVAYNSSTNGGTLKIGGAGNVVISGVVKDYSSTTNTTSLVYNGTGTLMLSGANTFTGGLAISSGTVKIGNAKALGGDANAVSIASGAVLDLNGTTLTGSNALTLNGSGASSNGALINSSSSTATYAGLVTLGSDSSIVANTGDIILSNTGSITGSGFGLTVGGAHNTTISSSINTGTGTLTKQGTGTLTLTGANSYTGITQVTAGTLTVNGSLAGTASVGSAGTLNGSGRIGGAVGVSGTLSGTLDFDGNVTVHNGGKLTGASHTIGGALSAELGATVSPGDATGDIGTLTAASFTLASGAHLLLDINGVSNADQIVVTGNNGLTLGGDITLNIGSGFTASSTDVLTLILNNGSGDVLNTFEKVTVTFDGITAEYSGVQGTILMIDSQEYLLSYSAGAGANDVALIAVPEPSAWAMFVGGLGALVAIQRRGRFSFGSR